MRNLLLPALLLLISGQVMAQDKSTLTGKITGYQSKPVAHASIHLLNTNSSAIANEEGNFSINDLYPGEYEAEISSVGYATLHQNITLKKGTNIINISLFPASEKLSEVMVTAQKTEEDLQRIPTSITALSAAQIESYQLQNIKDITAFVPNLYAADPGDKRNVTSIRGITTTSYNPAVAVYVDGVNQFSLDTYISTLFDVERIEILRGPQGTLYGRNAMAGVINIITKSPSNHAQGFASAEIGNYGLQKYSAGFSTPLVKNKLFMGIAGVYNQSNGFYTNDYNNKNYDEQHSVLGNYFLKYLPSSRWAITLNVKHNENRNHGAFPLVPDIKEAFDNPYHLSQNATTTLVDNIFNSSLSLNYSGAAFNFNSQTAYQSNYRYYTFPIDADFSPLDAITIINNYEKSYNHVKVVTQEFKFSSPATRNSFWNWTAGSYLFYKNNPVKQATHFGNDAGMLGMTDKNISLLNTSVEKSRGVALFGQAVFSMNPFWKITAGTRYDYEHQKQNIKGEYLVDPDPNPAFDFRSDTAASVHFSVFTPTLTIAYNPTQNNTGYLTYSKGYRVGGLTPLSSNPAEPALFPFKPEKSNNLEAGIKNNFWDHRLTWNLAVFYSNITDAQVPTLVLPDAVTITKNTGKLISKGIETEIMATPFKGLQANGSFGYTDAKYQNLKIAQNENEVNLKGKKQLFTPDVTSMLSLNYTYEAGKKKNIKLVAGGQWKYIGTQYFDLANTMSQKGYHLFNAKAGIIFKPVELMFWGRNLSNEHYISYAYDFGAVHLGDPSTYGVSVKFKF